MIESTKYLLGIRGDAPKELADFAMDDMTHISDTHCAPSAPTPSGPAKDASSLDTGKKIEMPKPVKSPVPIRLAPALDHHPLVAQILADRAEAIAKDPAHDVVIIVAHGPNEDQDNTLWLADMNARRNVGAAQLRTHRIRHAAR